MAPLLIFIQTNRSAPAWVNLTNVPLHAVQPPGGRGGHKCVRRILKESSNNGATAPPDEHQLAVGGLPLSEDIPSLKEVAGRMIGS